MPDLHLQLPSRSGRIISLPHMRDMPPANGRRLPNGTVIVTDAAAAHLLWKFTPWEKSSLAMNDLGNYARMQALDDPTGIVALVGVGGTSDHLVRVLERSHIGELPRFLRDERSDPHAVDPGLVHSVLAQIAETMTGLHALELVHRDLKAENILVFDADARDWRRVRVKVADFDRAARLARGGFLYEPVGSLFHMAPELLAGKEYDRRVDVYAFGILMFEVIHGGVRAYRNVATGMPGSLTASEFADGVREGGLRPEWRHRDALLHDLAVRCLSHDPRARPEFHEIFETLKPLSPWHHPDRQANRQRKPAVTLPHTVGMAGDIGRQRRVMEDAACVLNTADALILAVFDGMRGASSSDLAARRLALTLAHLLEGLSGPEQIEAAIRNAFELTQATLRRMDPAVTCGSTATVALLRRNDIFVAWLGDSPAWLLRKGADGEDMSPAPLTRTHHPHREDEALRVCSHGGEVRREMRMMDSGEQVPWGPLRVFAPGNAEGNGIAVSRALGLFPLVPAISAEPEIIRLERTAGDHMLVLCSDGVSEVLSPQQVQRICTASATPQSAADAVMDNVLRAGAPDNASVIVVDLAGQADAGWADPI